jgi:hypothetical protein
MNHIGKRIQLYRAPDGMSNGWLYKGGVGIKKVNMVCITVASTLTAVLLSTYHIKNLRITKNLEIDVSKDSLKSEPPFIFNFQLKKIKLDRSY